MEAIKGEQIIVELTELFGVHPDNVFIERLWRSVK
jgi:hypothetical protein